VRAIGESGSTGMPVVHEDSRLSGVAVQRSRHTTYIPPVAGGDQRQQTDRGVFRGV
jgi:hypothetical protein